jgi:hypothetical protein
LQNYLINSKPTEKLAIPGEEHLRLGRILLFDAHSAAHHVALLKCDREVAIGGFRVIAGHADAAEVIDTVGARCTADLRARVMQPEARLAESHTDRAARKWKNRKISPEGNVKIQI